MGIEDRLRQYALFTFPIYLIGFTSDIAPFVPDCLGLATPEQYGWHVGWNERQSEEEARQLATFRRQYPHLFKGLGPVATARIESLEELHERRVTWPLQPVKGLWHEVKYRAVGTLPDRYRYQTHGRFTSFEKVGPSLGELMSLS